MIESIIRLLTFFLLILTFSACNTKTDKVTLTFGGDIMLDRGTRKVIERKGTDFLFEDIRSVLLHSGYTIANLECTAFNDSLKPVPKKFNFRANPEWLPVLRNNGISYVTLANNHAYDFGDKGIVQTLTHLKNSRIQAIGYRDSLSVNCQPALFEKGKTTVAVFNSTFLQQDNSIICNYDEKELVATIHDFKTKNPSCLIFVVLHWGIEMELRPQSEQKKHAHTLIDQGATVIIGHHPHVVQTIEKYNNGFIFYSIGHFIFDNNQEPANKGILAQFDVDAGQIKKVRIIPFNIVNSKPIRMTAEQSATFQDEIKSISPGVKFQQDDRNWELVND